MSAGDTKPIADHPDQLTTEWLTAALRSEDHDVTVTHLDVTAVGTGQMGESFRLRVTYDGPTDLPSTMVAKLPSPNEDIRSMVGGAYKAELSFYRVYASRLAVRAPAVHYMAANEDHSSFVLVLEDLAPREQGDQIGGCTPDRAEHAVVNLAGLHAGTWCDPTLVDNDWLNLDTEESAAMTGEFFDGAVDLFLARLGTRFGPDDPALLRDIGAALPAWLLGRRERFALIHGDYRLDNLMFPVDADDTDVVALDWQTQAIGLPTRDVAYLLETGLEPDVRRATEDDLVAAYHGALLAHGVADYPLHLCFEDYRFAMLQGPLITIFGAAYGTQTDRGDDMFTAMLTRSLAAIRDLDSLALI